MEPFLSRNVRTGTLRTTAGDTDRRGGQRIVGDSRNSRLDPAASQYFDYGTAQKGEHHQQGTRLLHLQAGPSDQSGRLVRRIRGSWDFRTTHVASKDRIRIWI